MPLVLVGLTVALGLSLLLPAAQMQQHLWGDCLVLDNTAECPEAGFTLTVNILRTVGFFDSETIWFTIPVIAFAIVTVLTGFLASQMMSKGPMIRTGILGLAVAVLTWFAILEAALLHHPEASTTVIGVGGIVSGVIAALIFLFAIAALIASYWLPRTPLPRSASL